MELPAGVGLEVRGDTAGLVTSMDSSSSEYQVDSSVEENNLKDMPVPFSTDHITQQRPIRHVSDDLLFNWMWVSLNRNIINSLAMLSMRRNMGREASLDT